MCSGLVSSCAFHFVSRASVQKTQGEQETPDGLIFLQETTTNHRANSGPLSPKPNSWPICTSPSKALYETVIVDRGIAGTATSDPAASPSSLSDLSVASRDESADVKWGHNIVAVSF